MLGEKNLLEIAIDDGLLGGRVDGAGGTALGSPAELSIAGMLLPEPAMDVAKIPQALQLLGLQQVVDHVQHG